MGGGGHCAINLPSLSSNTIHPILTRIGDCWSGIFPDLTYFAICSPFKGSTPYFNLASHCHRRKIVSPANHYNHCHYHHYLHNTKHSVDANGLSTTTPAANHPVKSISDREIPLFKRLDGKIVATFFPHPRKMKRS